MSRKSEWVPVEGQGAVHSYTEVHHAIQPAFKAYTPYLVLLVDLDTQKGKPTEHEALRVVGNLATPDGKLAPPRGRSGSASARACAWCSPMSRRASRCRNGPSTRPRPAARRGDTAGRGARSARGGRNALPI